MDGRDQWEAACCEAHQLTLGEDDDRLDQLLNEKIGTNSTTPWVLVGGPPCQAFSLAGRSRNAGIKEYVAAADTRHFLYRHYLHILSKYRPSVFILENVKGMLSSSVDGTRMFPKILTDLRHPGGPDGPVYKVIPMARRHHRIDEDPAEADFLLRAEQLGVPQARHRVVLLGIRDDLQIADDALLDPSADNTAHVCQALSGLPELRSSLTDSDVADWKQAANRILARTAEKSRSTDPAVAKALSVQAAATMLRVDPGTGGRYIRQGTNVWRPDGGKVLPPALRQWLFDDRLKGTLNHYSRGHMQADLERYAYAATHARIHGRSPRGPREFPAALAPAHKNWAEGKKFVDRFNVQRMHAPSSTITSHLAKDGHYFIHPDVSQLRSLSVREAARLQTFPDNFFFEGPAGAQRKQVGNAVPPYLARQIASVVFAAINGNGSDETSSES